MGTWARRAGWALVVAIGILLGVVLGRIFLPPIGQEPDVEGTSAPPAASPTPS